MKRLIVQNERALWIWNKLSRVSTMPLGNSKIRTFSINPLIDHEYEKSVPKGIRSVRH